MSSTMTPSLLDDIFHYLSKQNSSLTMVGFGSSLRMGRRSGWEAAYLDYETLKLLLSQVESVYEEGVHHNPNSRFGDNPDDPNEHHHRKSRRDYRDELFLESDSDAAFASFHDEESSDTSDQNQEQERVEGRTQGAVQRFTLMGSFSSDESGSPDDDPGQCGGVPWRRAEKKEAKKGKKRRSKLMTHYDDDNEYYLPNREEPKSFFVDEDSESFDPATRKSSSLFNAPFQYNLEGSTESTALLGFSPAPRHHHEYTTGNMGDRTPPRQNFGATTTSTVPFSASKNPSPKRQTQQEKWEGERQRVRKQRRRRRLARQRKKRDKKVPPHIRLAHSKSRSITERFLGLLRAEVEKVTLFAQARLGELADTAGSLRFLSSEELTELSESFAARATSTAAAYDHPLSDGGIHSAASSSSDEGARGQRGFWSGSSSDENESHGSNQFALPQAFAGGVTSPKSARHTMAQFSPLAKSSSSPDSKGKRKQEYEQYEAAKRKIEHFQEIRRERPIFQRNDHIVGEDLLLVSAVDEADAYSAVGVELLHILKYICVNVIAVRKICRKHDRLLQNRMLGGYYHRKRNTRAQEERTLGGLIAHVAGDIYEHHPALIGLVNHGKLMGVYDLKLQQLANSRTVKVISSCLALALSEYEVSRTRADALATLTKADYKDTGLAKNSDSPSPFLSFDFNATSWVANTKNRLTSPCKEGEVDSMLSDDDRGSGPPSTASSVSLARLRFTVLSIAALREASRIKANSFATYLSRSSLSFTGHAVVGEGLDGCSRDTLNFLVYYTPDAALLLDSGTLYEGLRYGKWRTMSIASVMRSSLAVGLRGGKSFKEEEQIVINSLSILPKSEGLDASAPLEGRTLPIATSFSISRFVDIPAGLLRCNRYSLFLYTVNYYIVHPTAVTFADAAGANVAYSAAIIGASSFSAILAAVLHCSILVGHTNAQQGELNTSPYKGLLIFSSIAAIAGNVVQARGIANLSVPIAVLGRFLIGLGASDIVHRQFVVAFLPPSLIVAESARLVQFQAIGLVVGFFVGSLVEIAPFRSVRYGVQSLQASNWIMVFFWFLHLCRLIFSTRAFQSHKSPLYEKVEAASLERMDYIAPGHSSDSSDSDPTPGGAVSLFHQPPELRDRNERDNIDAFVPKLTSMERSLRRTELISVTRQHKRKVLTLMKRLRKLMAYNIAVPLTLGLVVYAVFAQEVLFSSCTLIADRYFGWRGNVAGFFLGCLSLMILPVDFACEQVARRYEERATIKRSILLLALGLLVTVNWGSVFAMVANLKILFTETMDMRHHYYDWLLGIPQYVVGFLLTFTGVKALQGASRSLLSKVSPPNMRYIITNLGTIVTFVGLVAQFVANFQIVAVGLSHRVINTDIVNSLVMPLLIGCVVAYYFVRKHYFFLM